jgi:putative spermidine/putrescine transport system permease protein
MPRRSGGFFLPLFLLTFILLTIMVSPFVVVVLGSFLDTGFLGVASETWAAGKHSLIELRWFGYVWHLYSGSFGFSLKLGVLTSFLVLIIGVPGGYGLAKAEPGWCRLLESLVMLPLNVPGIAISIGLIQAFPAVRGHWWIILAGHVLYTLPFMVRLVINTLRSSNFGLLEACASTLGATLFQRFWMVALPNLRSTILTGLLIVFAVSWGEFNVSYLLNTPIYQTYPAALFATYTSNSFQVAGAATVLFLAVLVPVFFLIQWIGAERTQVVEQGI